MEYNIPKRKFCAGKKKLVAWRLPETLLKEIDRIAKDRQWSTSDVVQTALDSFVQWEKKQKK